MAYQKFEVTGGETPAAAKWNTIGDNDEYLKAEMGFPGQIQLWAGSNDPANDSWLLCDGRAVSRSTYSELFGVIADSYGVGDGSTTFNLPNLMGRIPVGLSSGETEFNVLGKSGGSKTNNAQHSHTANWIGDHSHGVSIWSGYEGANRDWGQASYTHNQVTWGVPAHRHAVNGSTGGGGNHSHACSNGGSTTQNNLQPYITVNYIIKVK